MFKKHIKTDTSWWDEVATVLHPALGEIVKEFTETEKSFKYHPFQPIAITNFDKQQTGITLTAPLLPAFILKAGEDVVMVGRNFRPFFLCFKNFIWVATCKYY